MSNFDSGSKSLIKFALLVKLEDQLILASKFAGLQSISKILIAELTINKYSC